MKISIFGSCRQDTLYNNFQVTTIKNYLTYPHYSKEIVQAIEFCKGISNIPRHLTRHAFRSGILLNCELDSTNFKKEYEQTELFVLEISSRICYKYQNYYVHHILTEREYGFNDIDNIQITNLTDEEIEQDILKMKELLYPKPFIIVTHIYTYLHGKRYELVKLLHLLCKKHNIPIFDPMEQTKEYENVSLFQQEKVLSHYNDNGKNVIEKKYIDFISSLNLCPVA